ncbi:Hypothetical predicted protein, partial [Paramuricea clavata]
MAANALIVAANAMNVVASNECGSGGIKMNGTCDECHVFESDIIHPEQLGGEEEIHANEHDDNLVGEAEEAVG